MTLLRALPIAIALLAGLPSPSAGAGPRPDHNEARDAVRSGRARPLSEIIANVQRYCPGRFLDAQLRERRGGLFYHVRILSNAGRRVTIVVDAGTGAIVAGRCN